MSKEQQPSHGEQRATFRDWMGLTPDISVPSVHAAQRSQAVMGIESLLDADERAGNNTDVSLAAFGISQIAHADYLLRKPDFVYSLGTVLEDLSDKHEEAYKRDVFSLYFDASTLGQTDAQKRVWSLLAKENRAARRDAMAGNIVFFEDYFPLVEEGVTKYVEMGKDADDFMGTYAANADHEASLKLKYFEAADDADESVKAVAKTYRDDVTKRFLRDEFISPRAAMGVAARLYTVQDDPERKTQILQKFAQTMGNVTLDMDSYTASVWFGRTVVKGEPKIPQDVKKSIDQNIAYDYEHLIQFGEDPITVGTISADFQVAAAYYEDDDPKFVATTLHTVYQNLYEESSDAIRDGISERDVTNDAWENALGDWATFYAEKGDFEGANIFLTSMSDDALRADTVTALLDMTTTPSEVDSLRPHAGEDPTQIPATDNVFIIHDTVAGVQKSKELTDAIKTSGRPIKERMQYGRQLIRTGLENVVDRYVDGMDHPILKLERARAQVQMGDIRGLETMQRVVEELEDPAQKLEWHINLVVLSAQEMVKKAA